MPFSFRLDPETEARIRRLAKASGRSRSAVVRDAVSHYDAAGTMAFEGDRTALDRVRPFVGVVTTDRQQSVDTHARYRAALRRKSRDRHSR